MSNKQTLSIRVTPETLARIDALMGALPHKRPTLEVSKSDFVRMILLEGIATLEREASSEMRAEK